MLRTKDQLYSDPDIDHRLRKARMPWMLLELTPTKK